MKILVIDDNALHLEAAKAQLKDHDVTVAQTYDDGQTQLGFTHIYGQATHCHTFEVVLVDLLMPASAQMCSRSSHVGKELPVGIFLGLLAAKNGAKYVGVFTDSDHHSHPASACFDALNALGGEAWPDVFVVAGAKMVLSNNRGGIKHFDRSDLANELAFDDWYQKNEPNHVRTKDWRVLLERLLSDK